MKIVTRLWLLFLLVAVLPLALFSYFNLQQGETALGKVALGGMSGLADKKTTQVKGYLAERVQDVRLLARGPRVLGAIGVMSGEYAAGRTPTAAYVREDALMRSYFGRYIEEPKVFYDVFLITPQGEIVYTQKHEADFATNLLTGPWRETQFALAFRNASMMLEPVISGYEHYGPSQAPALFIAAPIMVDGKFMGVFAIQLGNELFFKVANDATGLGLSGEAAFAQRDGEGFIVTTPLKHRPDAALKLRLNLEESKKVPMWLALAGEAGAGRVMDYRDKQEVSAWRYLPELDWGVVVKVDADEVFAPIYQQRTVMLEVLAGLLLLSGLIAYYFGRQISLPLEELAKTADEIARGNLDKRVDESAPGELGLFAQSFNRMAAYLQTSYRSLEERIEQRTEALRQSIATLKIKDAAIASSLNAIAIAGLDGKLTYVNQAFVELWHLHGPEDAIGRSPVEFWDKPEDAQVVMLALQRHGYWQGELVARRQDGSLADLQLMGHMVMDDAGLPVCMMGSFVDITDRKLAEQKLQNSEALLDSIIANIPVMMFLKRASDLRFVKLNRAGEVLLGYAEQELLGKNDQDFFPREQAEFFMASDREVLAGRQMKDVPEEPVLTHSGDTRILHTRKIGIYDAAGAPTHLLGVSIDITEQSQAENKIRAARDQLEATIDAIPDLLFEVGLDGTYYDVHAQRSDLLAAPADDLFGKTVTEVLPVEAAEVVMSALREAQEHGHSHGRQFALNLPQGDSWFELSISRKPVVAGQQPRFIVLSREITARKKLEQELQHNRDLLSESQQIGHLGSWELNLVSGELRWTDEIYRMFELDPAKFLPSYENFLNVIHPDDRDKVNKAYTQSLADRKPYDVVHRLLLADGRIKWVREQCSSDFDASGKPLRSVGVVQDITEQTLAENRFRVAAVAFETHEAIMITDANANIISVNQAFQDITGYKAPEVLGKNPNFLSSGQQDKTFYDEMWQQLLNNGSWSGEIWDRRKDGQIYPKWLTITAVKNESGETTGYVGIFNDITMRKQAEEEIRNLAFYDGLTKLPNRRLLLDRFRLALSLSARSNHYGAVLFLDLDRFKTINDTLGHDHGDMLLVEVAARIKSCVREADTVARLGGDEFVILIESFSSNVEEASQKVALIAEKIRAAVSVPYWLNGHEYHSSPSIGVCLYCGNAESVDALLKHADMAMYQAKESGRNAVRFFDPVMQKAVESRAEIEADLRRAVSGKQLCLHYQIQVDSEHRPLGAEALVRWMHPERGMIPPGQFIPVAEESALIQEIGHWVLDTACQQLAAWSRSELTRELDLAVNVSGQQFRMHDFVDQVAAALRAHRVDPSRLKLELTESVVLNDVADVVVKMHALKAIGVRLSMDDFGMGYSSLSYLKQLPLDQLKIDQSFVRDIATDFNDAVMVQTIIDLAKNFRLNVIAEGVETQEQLEFLRANGCMAYQGFLFSKPVPIAEFEKLLTAG